MARIRNKKTFFKVWRIIFFSFLLSFLGMTFPIKIVYSGIGDCEPWCSSPFKTCNPWDDCNGCAWCIPTPVGQKPLGQFEGIGPLGKLFSNIDEPLSLLNKVVSIAIGFITLAAFLYFMFQFFTAGLSWVTAGGDQKKIESAGNKITNGIIGMVIVISAIFVIDLLGKVLGIDILNPFEFIVNIWTP